MYKKRAIFVVFSLLLVAGFLLSACAQAPSAVETVAEEPTATTPSEESVTLTLGNWRPDDVDQMERILAKFHEAYPNIIVEFDPTDPPEYDAATRTQMETGTGTDLYYLRSAGISFDLYNEGHFVAMTDSLDWKISFQRR